MSSTIGGISGVDWAFAPRDATHVMTDGDKSNPWYKVTNSGVGLCYESPPPSDSWGLSHCWGMEGFSFVSKDEDLGMDKKEVSKQVSCIEDLEVGMFFKTDISHILITGKSYNKVCGFCVRSGMGATYTSIGFSYIQSWSYTYNGEYTPIVKETEADIKIKELEATIELAQKQLQEYREMK